MESASRLYSSSSSVCPSRKARFQWKALRLTMTKDVNVTSNVIVIGCIRIHVHVAVERII